MADPWVAPDTPAGSSDNPPAGVVMPPPPAPRTHAGRASGALTAPTPLRPMTIPDILDGALRAWKLAPALLAGIAAVFVVPPQVLLGVLSRHDVGDVSLSQVFDDAFTATGPSDVESGFGSAMFFLTLVVQGIALAFATGAVARVVTGWYTGHDTTFGAAVRAALRRSWALVLAWVLVHLVEAGFALLLLVPAVVPMTWFAVTSAAVTCEGASGTAAMRRSYRLTTRRFGAVLVVCLLTAAVDVVLSASLTAIGALYIELDLPIAWFVNLLVASGALLVTTPFVAAAVTLLYLDLRVRTEGLDIELAASRRFGA